MITKLRQQRDIALNNLKQLQNRIDNHPYKRAKTYYYKYRA